MEAEGVFEVLLKRNIKLRAEKKSLKILKRYEGYA